MFKPINANEKMPGLTDVNISARMAAIRTGSAEWRSYVQRRKVNIDLARHLHPQVAKLKAEMCDRWGSNKAELVARAQPWIRELRHGDPFYFFEGFFHDGNESLHVLGYLIFQQLLLAIEIGGLTLEELHISEREMQRWHARCRQVERDMKDLNCAPYLKPFFPDEWAERYPCEGHDLPEAAPRSQVQLWAHWGSDAEHDFLEAAFEDNSEKEAENFSLHLRVKKPGRAVRNEPTRRSRRIAEMDL